MNASSFIWSCISKQVSSALKLGHYVQLTQKHENCVLNLGQRSVFRNTLKSHNMNEKYHETIQWITHISIILSPHEQKVYNSHSLLWVDNLRVYFHQLHHYSQKFTIHTFMQFTWNMSLAVTYDKPSNW